MAEGPSDPLSYFAAYGSSESESEPESEPLTAPPEPRAAAGTRPRPAGPRPALPAPDELFGSVSRPSFLTDPRKGRIDWDRRLVRAPEEPPKEFKVWKTNAVPPPETYTVEERKAPSGVDMAVKWSSMYQDNGDDAPQRTSALPPEAAEVVESDEENAEEPSNKKRKIETFQQKEKRKRNEGQANREKSFVEEEKRILRQEFCFKE
ncbi:UPF0690 protein C1orf52 homolog [Pristis pectinata]|uniref:UPF0690 protein C1orf52 homolog n=1 Tax=Pristis pectinata TaxID=685728 RepID=UPI00223D3EA0|nr:UPF0690 protein C1orf52 homolog [Pristis pectinata]